MIHTRDHERIERLERAVAGLAALFLTHLTGTSENTPEERLQIIDQLKADLVAIAEDMPE